jgi:hypothetical protein
VIAGPLTQQPLNFIYGRNPPRHAHDVVNEQCRCDIHPMIDHFSLIPKKMNFSFYPQIFERLAYSANARCCWS